MIKRTIEISRQAAHLAVKLDQLLIEPYPDPRHTPDAPPRIASIPCEDIGLVVVDHPACTYSHRALSKLIEFGAALVVCGPDHLPAGLLLPLSSHTQVVWRVRSQIAASEPTRKRLWQQLVRAKIRGQAANLIEGPARGRLDQMALEVKSGDSTHVEAQAAKLYWSSWLQGLPQSAGFRRDPDGEDPANVMLNYGYAIARAAVGRALVSAGLFPALGLHHSNRSNAFCLADDLVEPLRPIVDRRVRDLLGQDRRHLDQLTKAYLLEVLTQAVTMRGQTGPLMVALHDMSASLARCLEGADKTLMIPQPTETSR
jgi:CRISPR-associated protein Cas1